MLGLRKFIAVPAIIVLLLTTLFTMVGSVLAEETKPAPISDQSTIGNEGQAQGDQAPPIEQEVAGPSDPGPIPDEPSDAPPVDTNQGKGDEPNPAPAPELTTPPESGSGSNGLADGNPQVPPDDESKGKDEGEVNSPIAPVGPDPGDNSNSRGDQGQEQCQPAKPEAACSIYGYSLFDKDGDGKCESGMKGIGIWAGDTKAITDGDGYFCFENLEPGKYLVWEEVPDGWRCTTENPVCVKLECGEEEEVDFGNTKETGSICGYKFNDINGNGTRDKDEPGIGDMRVMLWYFWGYQETWTTEGGYYCFDDLGPGWYKVEIDESTAPEGMEPTTPVWSCIWLGEGQECCSTSGIPGTRRRAPSAATSSTI